jgi:carboxyl-terminal processing protease
MFIIKKRNFTFLLIVAFFAGLAVFGVGLKLSLGLAAGGARIVSKASYEEYSAYKENYGELIDFDAYIRENYYEPVPDGVLETGAYKGMFASLGDRYTVYYTAEEYRRQSESTQGEFSGIGATIVMDDDGYLRIVEVLPGGAAEKEGLLAEDLILSIDGAPYPEDLDGAVALLHGEEGSELTLLLRRGDAELEKTLVRTKVITPSVSSELLADSGLGYIRVQSFANQTAEDFGAALRDMEEKQARGLIIDLRNNGGGLVDRGVEIADMLLDAGTVATLRTNDKDAEPKAYTTADGATSLPYVLLVNGGTASTSEILAGAIKDNRGGYIVGAQTTGKGILQRLERFTGGDGARITIAQYFTPNGDAVNGVGITPDFIVDDPDPNGVGADMQMEKAIELLTGG